MLKCDGHRNVTVQHAKQQGVRTTPPPHQTGGINPAQMVEEVDEGDLGKSMRAHTRYSVLEAVGLADIQSRLSCELHPAGVQIDPKHIWDSHLRHV